LSILSLRGAKRRSNLRALKIINVLDCFTSVFAKATTDKSFAMTLYRYILMQNVAGPGANQIY
ncbi:MAG: hypothetical protein JW806_10390, partial [Sedimentisphaerales bacterium]|nr:hypothetical protein [Sedimentisphaerales bacterium]